MQVIRAAAAWVALVAASSATLGCGSHFKKTSNQTDKPAKLPAEVELVSRGTAGGAYGTDVFSFRLGVRGQSDGELLFAPATEGGADQFDTITSPNQQLGAIADLGAMACKDLPNASEQAGTYPGKGHAGLPYKEDRVQNPLFWLQYTQAWTKLRGAPAKTDVQEGHCYILERQDDTHRTIAVFHVKAHVAGSKAVIDELEIFDRSTIRAGL